MINTDLRPSLTYLNSNPLFFISLINNILEWYRTFKHIDDKEMYS